MSETKFFAVDPGLFAGTQKFLFHGVEYQGRLSPGDLPVGFFVNVDAAARRLAIRFHYLAAPDEARVPTEVNSVRVELGARSKRLFSLTITNFDARSATSTSEAAGILRDMIAAVFVGLNTREAPPGTRINYQAAGAGLSGLNDAPPPWMTEALKTLRAGRHSIP